MGHSGSKAEELVHKADFACHVTLCQAAMAAADHPHHLEAFDGGGGCCHPLEAAGRPDDALECSMVGLNDAIQIISMSGAQHFSTAGLPSAGAGLPWDTTPVCQS